MLTVSEPEPSAVIEGWLTYKFRTEVGPRRADQLALEVARKVEGYRGTVVMSNGVSEFPIHVRPGTVLERSYSSSSLQ